MRKAKQWKRWVSSALCLSMILSFLTGITIPVYADETGADAEQSVSLEEGTVVADGQEEALAQEQSVNEWIAAVSADSLTGGLVAEGQSGSPKDYTNITGNLGGSKDGSTARYNSIAFDDTCEKMELYYSASSTNNDVKNAIVEVYLDDASDPIAVFTGIDGTGSGWDNFVSKTALLNEKVTGTHAVTLKFLTNGGNYVMNLNALRFLPAVHVTGVTVEAKEPVLKVGETTDVTAKVLPEDADNKTVTWSSSDAEIASVDENGTVTAKKANTVTITATTEDGQKTGSCTIKVLSEDEKIAVTGVTLGNTQINLTEGKTRTLVATVAPENADNKSVTWSSSNDAVAAVDASGKVTAKGVGTATITVTTVDGSKTASCAVTVKKTDATSGDVLFYKDFVTENELPCASVSGGDGYDRKYLHNHPLGLVTSTT